MTRIPISKIKESTEEAFMEATASTFDAIAKQVERIREAIDTDDLLEARNECLGLEMGATRCAEIVRERAS